MDTLFAPTYDEQWSTIDPTHRGMVERFLTLLLARSRILDAACGTGKYFPMLLADGHQVTGIDQSAGMLRHARAKYPTVHVEKLALQDLTAVAEYDGAVCIDSLELIVPEDWPLVLATLHRALMPGGVLYLTVELPETDLAKVFEAAAAAGLPVVPGEYAKNGGYHFYPDIEQVRIWLAEAAFETLELITGDGYHHLLVRRG